MNAIYNIYVYELQGGEYLLCPSLTDCTILECEFMYSEICLNNRVHKLLQTITEIEGWQIDGLVHAYMHQYGTNKVYGGSYNNPGLNLTTSDHIKFMTYGLHELTKRQHKCNILNTKVCTDADYASEIAMYDQLKTLQNKHHINRDIINEMEWVYQVIAGNQSYEYNRYSIFIQSLSEIYNRALQLIPCLRNNNTVYANPSLVYDSRVLPYERKIWNYSILNDAKLDEITKIYELAIYSMINREDELLYDMEQINIEDIRDKYILQQLRSL